MPLSLVCLRCGCSDMQEYAGICKRTITGRKIKGSCKHTKERAIIDRERA